MLFDKPCKVTTAEAVLFPENIDKINTMITVLEDFQTRWEAKTKEIYDDCIIPVAKKYLPIKEEIIDKINKALKEQIKSKEEKYNAFQIFKRKKASEYTISEANYLSKKFEELFKNLEYILENEAELRERFVSRNTKMAMNDLLHVCNLSHYTDILGTNIEEIDKLNEIISSFGRSVNQFYSYYEFIESSEYVKKELEAGHVAIMTNKFFNLFKQVENTLKEETKAKEGEK